MRIRSMAQIGAVMGLGMLAAASVGCELLVQLDRSAVDAGGDAGCPICSDVGAEDGDDSSADAPPADAP